MENALSPGIFRVAQPSSSGSTADFSVSYPAFTGLPKCKVEHEARRVNEKMIARQDVGLNFMRKYLCWHLVDAMRPT